MKVCEIYIVDDERFIVEGLVKTYPWESMGVKVVGYAVNPRIAIEDIKKKRPDIVLTDIRMKQMSGLEMIQNVKDQGIDDIVWIIMSAFKDFEYAKSACSLGAFDYLLKPVEEDELREVILRVKEQILKMHKEKQVLSQYQNFATDQIRAFEEYLVTEYSGNKINQEHLKDFLEKIGEKNWHEMSFRGLCFGIKKILKNSTEYNIVNQRSINAFEAEAGDAYTFLDFQSDNKAVIIIIGMEKGTFLSEQRIKDIMIKVEKILKMEIFYEILGFRHGLEGLKKIYLDAVQYLEERSPEVDGKYLKNQYKGSPDYILKALEYIDENLEYEFLNVAAVAEEVHLNPVYFGRMFHRVMQTSFKQYLLDERIKAAKELLEDTGKSVVEIGEQVGIPNASYFTQQFKKITGFLPTEYRKQYNEYKE